MHPILRVVLVIAGAVVGAKLGPGGTQFLAVLLGALTGLAISEVVFIRGAFASVRDELRDLHALIERRATGTEAGAAGPKAEPAPVRTPPRVEPAPYYERAPSRPDAPPPTPTTVAGPREEPLSRADWEERYIPRPIEPRGVRKIVPSP